MPPSSPLILQKRRPSACFSYASGRVDQAERTGGIVREIERREPDGAIGKFQLDEAVIDKQLDIERRCRRKLDLIIVREIGHAGGSRP